MQRTGAEKFSGNTVENKRLLGRLKVACWFEGSRKEWEGSDEGGTLDELWPSQLQRFRDDEGVATWL